MAGIGHNGPPEAPAPALLDAIGVFAVLRQACEAAGGQKAWAEAHGLTAQHVNDVLSCRRDISDRVLSALKLRRVVRYAQASISNKPGRKAA